MRTGALCRTAVSTSIALKPNAPSPVATITGRSGKARLAADAVWHADPDAAERPGIEHRRRGKSDTREAEEIAAVGDDDGIRSHRILKRREDPVRMHPPIAVRCGAAAMDCRSLRARSSCPARSFATHCRSTDDWRLPAASTNARSASLGEARISAAPRRLSRSSGAMSAMRTNCAAPKIAGEPYASWKSSRRPTVSTTSASPMTAPRIAPTTDGCESGTRPRLSPVSR